MIDVILKGLQHCMENIEQLRLAVQYYHFLDGLKLLHSDRSDYMDIKLIHSLL